MLTIGFLALETHRKRMNMPSFKRVKYILSFIKGNLLHYGPSKIFYALFVARKISSEVSACLLYVTHKYGVNEDTVEHQKYLDIEFWILENVKRVFDLGLHNGKPKKILDISTGAGFFPYVCRYFGHDVYSTDVSTNEMYNEIVDVLNIPRKTITINKFKSLELDDHYDIITSFMICFNSHKTSSLWMKDEWSYLFSDLLSNLTNNGVVCLSFNEEDDNAQSQQELLYYFKTCGANIKKQEVLFNKRQLSNCILDFKK